MTTGIYGQVENVTLRRTANSVKITVEVPGECYADVVQLLHGGKDFVAVLMVPHTREAGGFGIVESD